MELVKAQWQLGPGPDLLSSGLLACPLEILMPPLVKELAKALDPPLYMSVQEFRRLQDLHRSWLVGCSVSSHLWLALQKFEGHCHEGGRSSGVSRKDHTL